MSADVSFSIEEYSRSVTLRGRRVVTGPPRAASQGVSRAAILTALDMTPDAVFFLAPDLRILAANAAATGSVGRSADEVRAMRLDEVFADDGDGLWRAGLERIARHVSHQETLVAVQHCSGGRALRVLVELRWVEGGRDPLLVAIAAGRDQRELDMLAARGAQRDFLTSLPGRSQLEQRLRRVERRARNRHGRFAVLFVDLDHFKQVNDQHGHRIGDVVLKTLARRLRGCVRPADFVARYGGDEFVAIVEDISSEREVSAIVDRIRGGLSAPISMPGGRLTLTASVGVAIGQALVSASELVDQADKAMYRAKHAQRTSITTNVNPTRRAKGRRTEGGRNARSGRP
jgi:diguanylate cyclase (GGDEF)-like protein